eukprot:CAMPEP_0170586704 /NCGR_PEP_ID=MMETSP0224-20130122/9886_1 /TAXON_ID=285029 /ORGANISM="Togula jolla, Strain CCCM 725" /LENGTH=369 /DNA_ID=CAMNT_0010910267 /DNA_START=17 /DNA_END=1123 /DNA_ORIENTATION=-
MANATAGPTNSHVEEIDVEKVRARFKVVANVGRGAYGVVWKCMDTKTGGIVAVKKIFDAFQNSTDAQRTYREIVLLRQLVGSDNIVQLRDVMGASNDRDIYLIFDHMEADLHAVIRVNALGEIHKQSVMHQMLKCLKFLHSAGLVHRDLKPSNILIDTRCHIQMADFGLARSVAVEGTDTASGAVECQDAGDHQVASTMTDYVATRWYRAPEILLGSSRYTRGVDMWSLGCILGEMIQGRPIFPGQSTMNQLDRILEFTDKPSLEDIRAMESPYAATMLEALPLTPPRPIVAIFPNAALEPLHLLQALLQFNPRSRYSAVQALEHPYVCLFHDVESEPVSTRIISTPIDDNRKLHVDDYRTRLYKDVVE